MTIETQAQVTGATQLIGIVGDPVAQVRSPQIYNRRIAARGRNAVLVPLHLASSEFEDAMPALLRIQNLIGLIFTVPFKERAAAFADRILPVGRQVEAVNAMRREPDGRWTADMFDGAGLVHALAEMGVAPAGKRILVLGAGGAGRAIAISLAREGARALTLFDLDPGRAARIAGDVHRFYPGCDARETAAPAASEHDIVINATPVGMAAGDGLPAPLGALDPSCVVFDIVPQPSITPLLSYAVEAGCRVGSGQFMIQGQADAVLDFLRLGD
jgi:shikimate dehydrogenase